MHPDACFHEADRARCRALVEQVGFAMIFAGTPGGPRVVHAPVVWVGDDALQFHIARRNAIAAHLGDATVLCLVNGPDGYVSPLWYSNRSQVPTWNYVAVELEGRLRELDEPALRAHIGALAAINEARVPGSNAWAIADARPDAIDAMVKQIVGFELRVQEWRPTFKLSQNKSPADRESIARELDATGKTDLAQLMRTVPA